MPKPRGPDTDKRSDERKQAEQIYLESKGNIKLVEIAEKLKLPDNKIRKWKSMDNWEGKLHPSAGKESKKKQVERSTNDKGSVPPKRGAPKGNQNAKGGKGNPHPNPPPDATKHGAYSRVYWDVLDEEEQSLIDDIPQDEDTLLMEQIQLFTIRERRIMKAINKYRSSEQSVAISYSSRSESKRSFDNDDEKRLYEERQRIKALKGEILPGHSYNISTQTENKDLIIARLEQELTSVQNKKTKAIETLSKIRFERRRIDQENSGNDAVDDWIAAVLGEDVSLDE